MARKLTLRLPSNSGEFTIEDDGAMKISISSDGGTTPVHIYTFAPLPDSHTVDAFPAWDNSLAARAIRSPIYALEPSSPDSGNIDTLAIPELALYVFFALNHTTELVRLTLPEAHRAHGLLHGLGIPTPPSSSSSSSSPGSEVLLFRGAFWQSSFSASSFMRHASSSAFPPTYILSPAGRQHPVRPPKPAEGSIVYERWIPHLGQAFTIRVVDSKSEEDVVLFNKWHNDPRVAAAWAETGPLEHHRAYLNNMFADPHTIPVYGQLDGTAFMYAELYWAAEDNIAPFLTPGQATDWDRGMHVLVGEQSLRGVHRVQAWLPSIMHYLFLADSRTQRIVMEPRATNAKIIDYMCRYAGFAMTKHFDFPHKRAAMLELTRERFFQLAPFQPLDWTP